MIRRSSLISCNNYVPREKKSLIKLCFDIVFPFADPSVYPLDVRELPNVETDIYSEDQRYVLIINEIKSFQWVCSVEAFLGDELIWVHNGEPIPFAANISQVSDK